MAHEQPEVASGCRHLGDLLSWRRREIGQGEDLRWRGDVILRAGQQVERAADVGEVDAPPARLEFP
jgi:hypothetical protein